MLNNLPSLGIRMDTSSNIYDRAQSIWCRWTLIRSNSKNDQCPNWVWDLYLIPGSRQTAETNKCLETANMQSMASRAVPGLAVLQIADLFSTQAPNDTTLRSPDHLIIQELGALRPSKCLMSEKSCISGNQKISAISAINRGIEAEKLLASWLLWAQFSRITSPL